MQKFPNLQKHDFSHLTSEESISYVNQMNGCKKEKTLGEIFKDSNHELVYIMEQMLEFNPYFRPSAKELLQNKIFDSVRIKSNEKNAAHAVVIKVDRTMPRDYSESENPNHMDEKLLPQIKEMIVLEA